MLKHFFIAIIVLSQTILVSSEINIAVATNVSYAIQPLIKSFNQIHPEIKVQIVLGSSGKLFAQISHDAPYDLFMSANMKYPNRLYEANLTTKKPLIYARGALAILSQKKRDYCADIFVLKNPDIKKIALANPHTAPYGVATMEALKYAHLYQKLEKKFVYAESISQTVTYTISAADIGIVAKSSLYAPQMAKYKEAIHWTEIDDSMYTPIDQGMVLLTKSKHKDKAKVFYDFMQSIQAKEILKSFGYKVL